jgi:phosphonate transport system permease protein
VGLGPAAGVLALALHTTGVLGRLFAETLENADPEPELALQQVGAGRLLAFAYGQLPTVCSQWLAYTLYRWENNIRSATVLGIVGAGGLGQQLYLALSLFQQHRAASLIIAMLLLSWAVEQLSRYCRQRMG